MRNASSCAKWPSSGATGVHVFDRGYESLVWLGALYAFAVRFVLRWRHDYRLVDAQGQTRLAWKMVQGKRAWGKSRPLWDAKRRKHVQASVLAYLVTHPDFPQWPHPGCSVELNS